MLESRRSCIVRDLLRVLVQLHAAVVVMLWRSSVFFFWNWHFVVEKRSMIEKEQCDTRPNSAREPV